MTSANGRRSSACPKCGRQVYALRVAVTGSRIALDLKPGQNRKDTKAKAGTNRYYCLPDFERGTVMCLPLKMAELRHKRGEFLYAPHAYTCKGGREKAV